MIRWPIVALVLALLVAGVAYDRVEHVQAASPAPPFEAAVNPVMLEPARLSSVWYCPVGSAGGGYGEHTVEVVNVGRDAAVATVSVLTDQGPGPSIRLDLGPGTRRRVALAELETATAAGAVVEFVDGQGAVDHVVATPQGEARGVCATGASDQWHFAGGATTRDATYRLALLNPFPEDAVFDVRFETAGRSRTPSALQGAIVPAGSVRVIEVHAADVVAREAAVATTVTLRRGRVVAERLQTFDGALGPVGAALELGAPSPSLETWFPAGRIHEAGDQRLVLYNPGGTVAELDVSLQPFDPALAAAYGLVPLEVSVGPGRFEVVDLRETAQQLGLPLPFEAGVHVASVNGVPVVGERWSLSPPVDTEAIGAGGTELSEADRAEEPAAEAEAPAAGEEALAATVPVALARPAQAAEEPAPPVEEPVAEVPATEVPPAEVPAAEEPAAEVPAQGAPVDDTAPPVGEEPVEGPPPVEEVDVLTPPQATPTSGVVIDRGQVTSSTRWVLPGVPLLAEEGTALAIVGVGPSAAVSVRSVIGGETTAPLATVEVAAGERLLLPLTSPDALGDLVVESSDRIVVAVSLVDASGSLAVVHGVPVLAR